jgi:hypothetical protein
MCTSAGTKGEGGIITMAEQFQTCGIYIYPSVLTSLTEKDEYFAETGHNADTNISL